MLSNNDHRAHREWTSRPADQRFETLIALAAAVNARRMQSWSEPVRKLRARAVEDEGIVLEGDGLSMALTPTNWSFGQVARLADAPGGYLSRLPAELAVQNLNFGLLNRHLAETKVLGVTSEEGGTLQAVTGLRYGRIWDAQVVHAAQEIVARSNGRFFNPKDWSGRPSGLYASDRDCFLFFIDGGSMVDGGGERDQLHRGFYMWNSEVGAKTFGLALFLFRVTCGNHIIWGQEKKVEIRIRHSLNAPERFAAEAYPALQDWIHESVAPLEGQIRRAKAFALPAPGKDNADLVTWFRGQGFTAPEARAAIAAADAEEGRCATLWDAVQGITAYAKKLDWIDARTDLERRGGQLFDLVAN